MGSKRPTPKRTTKDYGEVIQRKIANDPELKAAVDLEDRIASVVTALFACDSMQLQILSDAIEDMAAEHDDDERRGELADEIATMLFQFGEKKGR